MWSPVHIYNTFLWVLVIFLGVQTGYSAIHEDFGGIIFGDHTPVVTDKQKPVDIGKPKPEKFYKPELGPSTHTQSSYHKPEPQSYLKLTPGHKVYPKSKPSVHYNLDHHVYPKPKPPVYHNPPSQYKVKPVYHKSKPLIHHKPKPEPSAHKKEIHYKKKPRDYIPPTSHKVYPKGKHISHGGHGYFPGGFSGKGYSIGIFPHSQGYGKGYKVSYKQFEAVSPLKTTCPYGWLTYGGSCYLFSREKLGWFQAQMKCQYMGGTLVVINSAHENSFVKLVSSKYHMRQGVWTGLNDVLFPKRHIWLWGYGHKQCGKFDWWKKEPSKGGFRHHCVALWYTYDYKWRVFNCARRQYYICEINPKTSCNCGY